MPRYFFDLEDGGRTVDEEGMELKGPDAAAAAALSILLDVGRFEVVVRNERQLTIVVRDESGQRIYRSDMRIQADWLAVGPSGSEAADA